MAKSLNAVAFSHFSPSEVPGSSSYSFYNLVMIGFLPNIISKRVIFAVRGGAAVLKIKIFTGEDVRTLEPW